MLILIISSIVGFFIGKYFYDKTNWRLKIKNQDTKWRLKLKTLTNVYENRIIELENKNKNRIIEIENKNKLEIKTINHDWELKFANDIIKNIEKPEIEEKSENIEKPEIEEKKIIDEETKHDEEYDNINKKINSVKKEKPEIEEKKIIEEETKPNDFYSNINKKINSVKKEKTEYEMPVKEIDFTCPKCGKESTLELNQEDNIKEGIEVECSYCKKNINLIKEDINENEKEYDKKKEFLGETDFTCPKCGKESTLELNQEDNLEKGIKAKCPHCKKKITIRKKQA